MDCSGAHSRNIWSSVWSVHMYAIAHPDSWGIWWWTKRCFRQKKARRKTPRIIQAKEIKSFLSGTIPTAHSRDGYMRPVSLCVYVCVYVCVHHTFTPLSAIREISISHVILDACIMHTVLVTIRGLCNQLKNHYPRLRAEVAPGNPWLSWSVICACTWKIDVHGFLNIIVYACYSLTSIILHCDPRQCGSWDKATSRICN